MRIINADTLKEAVSNSPLIDFDDYAIFDIIDKAPTVTIKEWKEEMPIYIKDAMLEALRPHGEWVVDEEHSITMTFYKCTNCNYFGGATHYRYCPHCGADMRGVNNGKT